MSLDQTLPLIFFFIALLYSSIGFGGGSSYLAILSLTLTNFYEIRSTALILNLVVVSIGSIAYFKNKVFDWKQFWPFLIPSIPMAYLGTQLRLSQAMFFMVLGLLLLLSGISLLYKFYQSAFNSRDFNRFKRLTIGGGIGFFAGLSGIGGGIYLSPILNMIGWKDAKKIASLSSAFIWVNSLAGLIGLAYANTLKFNSSLSWKLILGVSIGGLIGAFLSNQRLNNKAIGFITALLVIYVGAKLVLKYSLGILI
ncbi:sulfite exporter TauE/SafE family protein [Reichenbachiella versicolor]|uniref:sulfite exporter TauE/SafE family protein n=1 Tax=Reichenbachiella versicolor TaxID=1821036 RepID=UPI000D6E071A|nr:sulfite exporter TauE/SafE family protein [Reichenbachiella versicolor]